MQKFFSMLMLLVIVTCGSLQATAADPIVTIKGEILGESEALPFAMVMVKGTTIGATANANGEFELTNLPNKTYVVRAQMVGYKPQDITVSPGSTQFLKFDLEEDMFGLEEVVVTGDRSEKSRFESTTVVNTLSMKLMETTQSVMLCDGLNFSPGLRTENNCQNCGFTQVRMNGMEGAYSQILINSRPIFSGLAGVYGLELIPANMIDRVEVIRGGGSALYGSNAIAGTINLLLKDPVSNSYEFGVNTTFNGFGLANTEVASDYTVNGNASIVSDDNKTGLAIYGFYRDKDPFDANGDGFSESSKINNITFGARIFRRLSTLDKIAIDFFNIQEDRRGGDAFDMPSHMANISEAVTHNITTGAFTYDRFFRDEDLLSVYASAQGVKRDSYYGANQSLSDYGYTEDISYNIGTQYTAHLGESTLIAGIETKGANLTDTKLGYPDIDNTTIDEDGNVTVPYTENTTVADQESRTSGAFAQYEFDVNALTLSAGVRYDHYSIEDNENPDNFNSGDVFSPRVNLKYDFSQVVQARASFSQGYRAPQIFDEDLHIETSGARKVIHKNSADLKQETSNSYMLSFDINKQISNSYLNILVEGFRTKLDNPFVNEYGTPDEDGTVVYTRVNAEKGAVVQGINLEFNFVPSKTLTLDAGYTFQTSRYEDAQEFDEKKFFRTPDQYGFFALDWKPVHEFGISATGNYTGKMLVPYFGPKLDNPDEGVLNESDSFFDLGIKLKYEIHLDNSTMEFFGGMKNIFNSYQDDFDSGIDRDPSYVYGPMNPRTLYFGIKFGNMLE